MNKKVRGAYNFIEITRDMKEGSIGAHLSPTLADFNNDGFMDMLVGHSNGVLIHFVQDTINTFSFSMVDPLWMDWDGGTYSAPTFTDLGNDGIFDLIVGTPNGQLYHLIQDSLHAPGFTEVSNNFADIDVGQSAKPAFVELDNDDKLDLMLGEWYKGLVHYEQIAPGSEIYQVLNEDVIGVRDFGAKNGYAVADIDNDGLLDMLVATHFGPDNAPINHFEQNAQGDLLFNLIEERFNDIGVGQYNRLTLYDINGNGLLDLIIGDVYGKNSRYEQAEVNSYSFILMEDHFNAPMQTRQPPNLVFEDIDSDGLLDMLVGGGWGTTSHYEQDSVNAVTFTEKTNRFANLDVGYNASPTFTDLDDDGLLDLMIGALYGDVYHLEQDSVDSETFTLITNEFASVSVLQDALPHFVDVNLDGNTDLIFGSYSGGIKLFLRTDDEDLKPPKAPENLVATIDGESVDLVWSQSSDIDLMLYNIYRSTRHDTTTAEYINSTPVGITTYQDSSLQLSNVYYYWITALDSIGNESAFSQSDSVDIEVVSSFDQPRIQVKKFHLQQNYPNPFNPITTINYELPITNYVDLSIYNLLGQKVVTLVSGRKAAGTYNVEWDASAFPSGIYIYRLMSDKGYVESKKLILLK